MPGLDPPLVSRLAVRIIRAARVVDHVVTAARSDIEDTTTRLEDERVVLASRPDVARLQVLWKGEVILIEGRDELNPATHELRVGVVQQQGIHVGS